MEYLKHLFVTAISDTWSAVVGSTLSVVLVSSSIVGISLVIYKKWAGAEALKDQLLATASLVVATMLVGIVIFLCNLLFLTPKKLYERQKQLAEDLNTKLQDAATRNSVLIEDVERHRHGIVTTDPVFPNIIYLLQAFRMYRVKLGHDTKCTVYVTAPPDSLPVASVVAQFSSATSNCGAVGPMGGEDLPPSMRKEVLDGSTPGVLTIHAAEQDEAADELVNHLTSVFRVKRGYKVIPKGRLAETYPARYVWLQFGTNTQFASQAKNGSIIVR